MTHTSGTCHLPGPGTPRVKIVIACDSFKGCISSEEAGQAAAVGVLKAMPHAQVQMLTLADGGEGTVEAFRQLVGGGLHHIRVCGPNSSTVRAEYLLTGTTAVIEAAAACGLPLATTPLQPLDSNSYGVGQLILDALDRGAKRVVVGLGGTACTDGGMGMLTAMGARFVAPANVTMPPGGRWLEQLQAIDLTHLDPRLKKCELIGLVDVDNPLTGANGAAAVFGPQKGASPADIQILDRGLQRLAEVAHFNPSTPGYGAAGGMGAAMGAILGAHLRSGVECLLAYSNFDKEIAGATLVITGEGCIDSTSLMGKGCIGVLAHAKRVHVPVVGIAGIVRNRQALLDAGFAAILNIHGTDTPTLDPQITRQRIAATVTRYLQST